MHCTSATVSFSFRLHKWSIAVSRSTVLKITPNTEWIINLVNLIELLIFQRRIYNLQEKPFESFHVLGELKLWVTIWIFFASKWDRVAMNWFKNCIFKEASWFTFSILRNSWPYLLIKRQTKNMDRYDSTVLKKFNVKHRTFKRRP